MSIGLTRPLLVLGATTALAAGGTTFAYAQSPPAPTPEQETAGEAPESTGPENSATDPDNVQFEQQGENEGDNGQPDSGQAATTASVKRARLAAKHRAAVRKQAVARRAAHAAKHAQRVR